MASSAKSDSVVELQLKSESWRSVLATPVLPATVSTSFDEVCSRVLPHFHLLDALGHGDPETPVILASAALR